MDWVRLVRRGSIYTAYTSANGVDWQWLRTIHFGSAKTVLIGAAVSAFSKDAGYQRVFRK